MALLVSWFIHPNSKSNSNLETQVAEFETIRERFLAAFSGSHLRKLHTFTYTAHTMPPHR